MHMACLINNVDQIIPASGKPLQEAFASMSFVLLSFLSLDEEDRYDRVFRICHLKKRVKNGWRFTNSVTIAGE